MTRSSSSVVPMLSVLSGLFMPVTFTGMFSYDRQRVNMTGPRVEVLGPRAETKEPRVGARDSGLA